MNDEKVIKGYVLKQIEYGENDSIVSVLTENGIVTFKAKGILKLTSKNRSSCLMYAESEFIINSKNDYNILLKGNLINANQKIYSNIDLLTCIGLIGELILIFLGENVSKTIYSCFDALIKSVNNNFDIFTITLICIANIIKEAGYELDLSSCYRCGNKNNIVFVDFENSGFVCYNCLNNNEVVEDINYLKTIRYAFMVTEKDYFHYEFEKKYSIRLIKELVNYLKNKYDYKKLSSFELFNKLF